MSDIHALETNLDLKQNLSVYANCKQLDVLHLIFNIFDGGLQADLTNYKVRLKAMKADNMLLIQDTQYTINKNVVTIIPDEQLTTTSGTTKIELQFINTKTGEKKATFNLTLKVIPSVLENERTISTATYTLMDELENKLDKAASFFENINKAIDANTALAATTNNANTSNTNLNTTISAGNTLKTALDGLNTTANTTKSNLDTSNNNALATKTALDTSNSNAAANKTALDASNTTANTTKSNLDASNSTANSTKTDLDKSNANALATKADLDKLNTTANVTKADLTTVNDKATVTKKDLTDINTTANSTKTDLDAENVRAEANITAMESFGDITALSKNVTNLKAEVETARGGESDLDGRLDKIDLQLSDLNKNKSDKDGTLQIGLNSEMLGGKKVDNLTEYYGTLPKEVFQNANYLKGYTGSFKTDGTAWGTPNDGAEQYYQITYIPNGVTKNGYGTQVLNCYFGANVGRTFQRFSNGAAWGEWNGLLKTYNRQGINTDMNNVVEPGVYHIQLEYLTANYPIKQWATVYVSYIAHTRWVQQFWIGQTGETFIRYSYDGGNTTIWTPWKRVATTETVDLTLLNGWVAYSAGFDTPRATRIGNVVTLSGLIKNGTIGTVCAQLPAGWRPPAISLSATMNSNNTTVGRIDTYPDGSIYIITASSNSWVSLTGISFYVAN